MGMETEAELKARERGAFRLDGFLVEPQRNLVTGAGGAANLEPKVMDVLCALAARPGEVISRSELIDGIWGLEFGADESLTRAISHLRKVFKDSRDEPRLIETIPKRGYRLMAPPGPPALTAADGLTIAADAGGGAVACEDAGGPAANSPRKPRSRLIRVGALAGVATLLGVVLAAWLFLPREAPPPPAARTGIVVVVRPFTGDAGAPSTAGFAEELSAAAARSPLIRVRMETSADTNAMRYALTGDVRRVGAHLRVSTQLIDSASGEIVWGERYERAHDGDFSERERIVAAISEEFQLPLLSDVKRKLERRPIMSLAPWELILLVTWVPGSEARLPAGPPSENSYWLQERALELAPDYAPAHALFAELAAYHALFHPPMNNARERERARRHADLAVELAPYDAEVLYQIALYHRFSGDREKAIATLERVLELAPNHPLARIDLAFVQGQCSANSSAAVARLTAFDRDLSASNPARWVALAHLSAIHLARGEFAAAREMALRSRRIVPMTWTGMTLAAAYAELGENAKAAAVLAEHRREWPAMDVRYFADEIVPRWCLNGARASEAQATFRRLATVVSSQ